MKHSRRSELIKMMKKLRGRKGRPTDAVCKRCEKPFSYIRFGRFRLYCRPCVELERVDANNFFNAVQSQRRREQRESARRAHQEAGRILG